jgi:hypothetical protein
MFRQIANHASSTAVEEKAHVQELLHHAALLAIEHGLELDIGDSGVRCENALIMRKAGWRWLPCSNGVDVSAPSRQVCFKLRPRRLRIFPVFPDCGLLLRTRVVARSDGPALALGGS